VEPEGFVHAGHGFVGALNHEVDDGAEEEEHGGDEVEPVPLVAVPVLVPRLAGRFHTRLEHVDEREEEVREPDPVGPIDVAEVPHQEVKNTLFTPHGKKSYRCFKGHQKISSGCWSPPGRYNGARLHSYPFQFHDEMKKMGSQK
jgi:hypothetical protein